MAINLKIGDPILVAMGPSYKEAGWGTHQFPAILRLRDGRIVLRYHIVEDTCEDYGKENGWAISCDEGESWQDVSPAELPAIKAQFGVELPSGRRIREYIHRPWPIDDELHAQLMKKAYKKSSILPIEEVPDLYPKTWTYAINEPGSSEETVFYTELDYLGMTATLCKGGIVRPMGFGAMRVAPDGSLWQVHYSHGRNPKNLGYTNYYACYYFQSTDEGKSFHLKSWIQYLPDTDEFPDAFITEGFCEPDLCFMPDGSMITLMRTGNFTPSYIARSTDGGNTWSKPVKFAPNGVYPQLQSMGGSITLAVYGRPGLYVRATDDPSGMTWEDPVELMPYKDPKTDPDWEESCYYTSLLPLDDHTVLMAYSDFRIPDENGVARKCMMVRRITVRK